MGKRQLDHALGDRLGERATVLEHLIHAAPRGVIDGLAAVERHAVAALDAAGQPNGDSLPPHAEHVPQEDAPL